MSSQTCFWCDGTKGRMVVDKERSGDGFKCYVHPTCAKEADEQPVEGTDFVPEKRAPPRTA